MLFLLGCQLSGKPQSVLVWNNQRMAYLGLSAVKQVLIYAKKTYTPEEEAKLISNIEESAKK